MPPVGMRKRVEALPAAPLRNGLLNPCVTQIESTDPHEMLGVDWQPLGCCEAHCWDDPCDTSPGESPGESPASGEKQFCRPGWQTAPPVTVYAAVECSAVGFGYQEAIAQAQAALQLGQQRALEQFAWSEILAPMAVDRTPASGPVSLSQGLGLLEGWLAIDYGGQGVLHAPAAAGPLLCRDNQVRHEGQSLRTCSSGHCVVVGAGYQVNTGPDGVPALDGTVWLALSGPVVVRREPPVIVPGTDAESVRILTNDRQVIAERNFVVQVSCAVEMVLVEMGCCC